MNTNEIFFHDDFLQCYLTPQNGHFHASHLAVFSTNRLSRRWCLPSVTQYKSLAAQLIPVLTSVTADPVLGRGGLRKAHPGFGYADSSLYTLPLPSLCISQYFYLTWLNKTDFNELHY